MKMNPDSFSKTIIEDFQSFINYIKKNNLTCFFIIFISLFAYGFPLTNFTLSIDEERALVNNSNVAIWSGQGRFGIALIKLILHYSHTNSITATFLAVSALCLTSIIWAYIFYSIRENASARFDSAGIVISTIFLTFPAHSENIGFSIMSFELGIGWIAIATATFLTSRWVLYKKSKLYLVLGIALVVFATSIYQSYLPVYVCGVIICIILYAVFNKNNGDILSVKNLISMVGKYIFIGIMSLIGYKILDKLVGVFVPPTDYVSGFFAWGKNEPMYIISNLAGNFKSLIKGDIIFGSRIIILSLLAVILLIFIFAIKLLIQDSKRFNALIIVSLIGLLITPFLMSTALGTAVPIRANLVLSLFVASAWYLLYIQFKKNAMRNLLLLFTAYMSFYQAQSLSQLFYGDYSRYQQDVKLANQIGTKIQNLNVGESPSQPVVFIGSHSQTGEENVIKQEVIGYSFFEWDGGNIFRIRNFMKSLGYDFLIPTEEQKNRAIDIARTMPVWPDKNSVALKDNIIIVKLSGEIVKYPLELSHDDKRSSANSEIYRLKLNTTTVDFHYDMDVSSKMDGLELKSYSGDPQISFLLEKPISINSFDNIVIEFDSNISGNMQMFLSQNNESFGSEFNGYVKIKEGHNVIYCNKQTAMTNITGIRIDPPNDSLISLKNVTFIKHGI